MTTPIAAKPEILRVFIGTDSRQPVAQNVLQHSITRRSSRPVQVSPLIIEQLPISRVGLTSFTYSRFLVPWLCGYEGWALFIDSDMLVVDDIAELFSYADDEYDILVVKTPERFEWASVMLFNCASCTTLTPEFVQTADKKLLFGMQWEPGVNVGELPSRWNHLVGYSTRRSDAALIHYTQGLPIFPEIGECEYSGLWMQEYLNMNSHTSWMDIMGHSLHATLLGGEPVPKLVISDAIERGKRSLDQDKLPAITHTNSSTRYSREYPSPRFQVRIQAFKRWHLYGDADRIIDPQNIFQGTGMFIFLKDLNELFGKEISTLLDYGCGKTVQYAPVRVQAAQGEKQTTVKEILNLNKIECYDPGYPPVAELPKGKFDCVICIDVLDRCPESDLPWVLDELFKYSNEYLFIKVSAWEQPQELYEGEPELCTVKSSRWWAAYIIPFVKEHPDIKIKFLIEPDENGKIEDISTDLY